MRNFSDGEGSGNAMKFNKWRSDGKSIMKIINRKLYWQARESNQCHIPVSVQVVIRMKLIKKNLWQAKDGVIKIK